MSDDNAAPAFDTNIFGSRKPRVRGPRPSRNKEAEAARIAAMKPPPTPEWWASIGARPGEAIGKAGGYEMDWPEWFQARPAILAAYEGIGRSRRPTLWVVAECPMCGAPTKRANSEAAKHPDKPWFCGHACASKATNIKNGIPAERYCTNCGKVLPSKRNGGGRVCSDECRKAKWKEAGLKRQKPVSARPCETCGKVFKPANHFTPGRFCSRACKDRGHSAEMRGEANPGYRHGMGSARGSLKGFYLAKQAIWERDGLQCVVCGSERALHVHHINHMPNDHRPENLVLLCCKCHRRYHCAERARPSRDLFPWLAAYAEATTRALIEAGGRNPRGRAPIICTAGFSNTAPDTAVKTTPVPPESAIVIHPSPPEPARSAPKRSELGRPLRGAIRDGRQSAMPF